MSLLAFVFVAFQYLQLNDITSLSDRIYAGQKTQASYVSCRRKANLWC